MLPAHGYSPRRCVGQIPELTARRRGLEQAASCRLVPSSRYWPTIAGRTVTSPPLCHRLFTAPMCCRFDRDAGARSSTAMPHAAPLLPPSLLTPCAACLASSSLAPRRVGTMRWHTHARRMALSSATPWPAHPSQRRTDKRTPCRIHARSLLHLAAHTSTLALQLRRAVTSLSLSLLA
jgi:hypothetical protein